MRSSFLASAAGQRNITSLKSIRTNREETCITTLETVKRVQDSFAQVVPIAPQAATLFYQHLFSMDPSLKPLFKGDMEVQGEKLMQMIGTAVRQLHELESLVSLLQNLGKRHVHY